MGGGVGGGCVFFFFKQKTAYEMCGRDWSSDVCSSDLNSFGADSDGSDAEFYFAVSTAELLPFLRENNVAVNTNAVACRSFEQLNADRKSVV